MTRVVSVRIPAQLARHIELDCARANGRPSEMLESLLELFLPHAAINPIARQLPDTSDDCQTTLHFRVSDPLHRELVNNCQRLNKRVSAYVRTLLHNYYITGRIQVWAEGGHYKLAVSP